MTQPTEMRTPLLTAARSCLLLVDVQQRLAPAIADGAQVIEHCVWLARLAGELGVPVVITEHMAQKIGPTAQALREAAPSAQVAAKASFSAVRGGCLDVTSVHDREQIVVAGMEAHVCILQSAIDLQAQGKSVHVVAEACGSRRARDVELALARMQQHGIQVVSREMVAFEWLQRGDDPRFGEVVRRYIR